MRIESKLCHISENKAVVQVNGWINDKNVGSALAEAPTVEQAEDKAISRLNKRINILTNNQTNINVKVDNRNDVKVELPINKNVKAVDKNEEPIDWSNDLTAIDSEIQRLNWSRDDEIEFLEKNLGFKNRNKITKYKDLVNYLNILKTISNSKPSLSNITNIEKMIKETDVILKTSIDFPSGVKMSASDPHPKRIRWVRTSEFLENHNLSCIWEDSGGL